MFINIYICICEYIYIYINNLKRGHEVERLLEEHRQELEKVKYGEEMM